MSRIALTVSYDGRGFDGWQTQPDGNTVQDSLQHALGEVAQRPIKVVCAGRTDAGVHALRQVVHFDAPVERPMTAWVRGVNSHLPSAIAIEQASQVRPEFHARFDATGRQYQYLLRVSASQDPFWAGRAGWVFRSVDIARMRAAAKCLVGTHDFSAFRSSQCQAKTPIRTLESVTIEGSDELILFTFNGNAFLHHMIRNLIGSLIYVGQARQPVEWLRGVLAGGDRALAAPTFMPDGLYFCGAHYRADDPVPGPSTLLAPAFNPGFGRSHDA
ncbi:MAG: tRNA pseudouridine(38-40) synthase TruA [Burkholderiaceae bacterium]